MLPESLIEQVLTKLGLRHRPGPSPQSLRDLYSRWGRRVPFDNVRKLIHVRAESSGPLPGSTPEDFFTAWLTHGTGGTCWAGSGALNALLTALGFHARRGIATMLAAPGLPPNHGTLMVTFGSQRYLVDTSILHDEPLLLDDADSTVTHPAWGVRAFLREGQWHILWRPLHKTDGFECRIERFGASAEEYSRLYAATRNWSPFNYQVSARLNQTDRVTGLGFGQAVTLHSDGSVSNTPATREDRMRVLVEEIGLSEEIVSRLPEDVPTPPPPGSQSAQNQPE
jgi:N-hydroxyarylamine O-acetyltransferase